MALNLTTFFTIIGKDIKQVNEQVTYYTELETAKDAIYSVLNTAGQQDLYTSIPDMYLGFYSNVASWIQSLIGHAQLILTDEEFVLDELPIFASDPETVLHALFDYMVEQSSTLKASIVTLGGNDVDQNRFPISLGALGTSSAPSVFLTRTLDGVSPPSSTVSAHAGYNNLEGQLSMSSTIFAKVTSSSLFSEVLQLFADSPTQSPYTFDAESPGTGPSVVNAAANNLVPSNADFTSWSGNNPTDWVLAGGAAGTAWVDESTTGEGPLKINTTGVTLKRQIQGLTRRTMYFVAFRVQTVPATPANDTDWKLRIENVDGLTVHKDMGTFVILDADADSSDIYNYVYGFYSPSDSVNLDDIYLCLEYDAETEAGDSGRVFNAVISPVTYFNGLGFAFWNPYEENESAYTRSPMLVNDYGSIAIANGNQGVIQTFFRKAFNVQLPTDGAGAHTIADTLAT